MTMTMFEFIDDTIREFEARQSAYKYAEGHLVRFFEDLFEDEEASFVQVTSRIKNSRSLKEKLIRNKFYIDYQNAGEALDHLNDLIGLTIECRFISDESVLYQRLFEFFEQAETWYPAEDNENIELNLAMPQPQLQKNGFTIYRIDGHYYFNNEVINFELQIKSLVHRFWSEVEHKVVYKNNNYVIYDSFNKHMLASIRDNLEVVDRQLEIVANQIQDENRYGMNSGITENSFKVFAARTINDLVSDKLQQSLGFCVDFKESSATLSQFIYLREFLNSAHPESQIIQYIEHLNMLKSADIDYQQKIVFDREFSHPNIFINNLGRYFLNVANYDFEWHVFFVTLLSVAQGEPYSIINAFITTIRSLVLPNHLFRTVFSNYTDEEKGKVIDIFDRIVSEAMIEQKRIRIIHEKTLYAVLIQMHETVTILDNRYPEASQLFEDQELVEELIRKKVVYALQ